MTLRKTSLDKLGWGRLSQWRCLRSGAVTPPLVKVFLAGDSELACWLAAQVCSWQGKPQLHEPTLSFLNVYPACLSG